MSLSILEDKSSCLSLVLVLGLGWLTRSQQVQVEAEARDAEVCNSCLNLLQKQCKQQGEKVSKLFAFLGYKILVAELLPREEKRDIG